MAVRVTLIDINPGREDLARSLGLNFTMPDNAPADLRLVVHATDARGLATAIDDIAGRRPPLEMSWYGDRSCGAAGAQFHGRRLVVSSQVGRGAIAARDPSHQRRHGRALYRARDGPDAGGTFHRPSKRLPDIQSSRTNTLPTHRLSLKTRGPSRVCCRSPRPSVIAHSFQGAVFGPAQALPGATFVIDVAFIARRWTRNIVVDIGRSRGAQIRLSADYRNLDDVPEFKGKNTTTEFVTKYVFDKIAAAARAGELGREGRELDAIRVTISESHVARAWYEAPLW
jgi:hypothetical protein